MYVCFDGMFSVILLRFPVIKAKNFICFRQKLAYEEIWRKKRRIYKEKSQNLSGKNRIIQVFDGTFAKKYLFLHD